MRDPGDGLPLVVRDPVDGLPLFDPINGFPLVDTKNKCATTGLIDPVGFNVSQAGFTGAWTLEIWGHKPSPNMAVLLNPMIYVDRPEYWRIEILGMLSTDLKDIGPDFQKMFNLMSSIGTKGVELIGATMNENVDVPPGQSWGDTEFKNAGGGSSVSVG